MISKMKPEEMDPIDGSQPVTVARDGLVTTEDGRQWYWKPDPPVEAGLPSMGGEFIEYKSSY